MPDTRDLAYQDYLEGMKYKDIAKKYGVSLSAVKSWAARYWKKGSCNSATKKVATKRKDQKIIAEEVEQVLGNMVSPINSACFACVIFVVSTQRKQP